LVAALLRCTLRLCGASSEVLRKPHKFAGVTQWPIEARRCFNLTRAWIAVQNLDCIFSHGLLAEKSSSLYLEEGLK
jgi:hypothetical protein